MSTPPWSLEAEESAIGAALLERRAAETLLDLPASDFYKPAHQAIHRAVESLMGQAAPVDPVTVAGLLDGDEATHRQTLMRLQAGTPASANARAYCATVARLARFRRAIALAEELRTAGYDQDAEEIERLLHVAETRLAPPVEARVETTELDELLASPPPVPKPWVIPGLLLAGDTWVLSGGEGGGKMTIIRQCALGCAAGVHPFTDLPMRRVQALIVDLQEDLTDIRAELARPRAHVGASYQAGMLQIVARRQGVNLLGAHDARWFEAVLERVEPGLVVIGPLKKMYQPPAGRGIWDDDVVEALHRRLDDWITRFGFALILEGHAGHDRDTWRVKGSSAWYAWPHFGYGLDTDTTRVAADGHKNTWRPRSFGLTRWRGDRENGVVRHFPRRLSESPSGWLWAANPASTDAMAKIQAEGDLVDQRGLSDDVF